MNYYSKANVKINQKRIILFLCSFEKVNIFLEESAIASNATPKLGD